MWDYREAEFHTLGQIPTGMELPRRTRDFTAKGGVVLLANQLRFTRDLIENAKHRLDNDNAELFQLNAELVMVTVSLQSMLDVFTCVCVKHIDPVEKISTRNIYFHGYSFSHSELTWVIGYRDDINDNLPKFKGMSFKELANRVKHVEPWLGETRKINRRPHDIYDSDGVGLVHEVIVKVYKLLCEMTKVLANTVSLDDEQVTSIVKLASV